MKSANYVYLIAPASYRQSLLARMNRWVSMWTKVVLAEFLCRVGSQVE
jgi:hypothetical protein